MSSPLALAGGRYQLGRQLGRGGMGAVYLATDTVTGDEIAIKRLRDDRDDHKRERAELRFRREYHTLAALKHPRIIEVFDFMVDPTGSFYTMELLGGTDLGDHAGKLTVPELCAVLRDVTSALALLHTRGFVHRDLAPRNIRVLDGMRAKLIDFGVLANVGASGDIAGTIPYIAPEGVRGMPVDGRTDLYSLGALAYILLTRKAPFRAKRLNDLEHAWQRLPTPPADLVEDCPEALSELVMSLLCIDPLGRPASAAEVIERLTAIGDLPPMPQEELSEGYLASAVMVGRRREMRRLHKAISRAVRGKGSAAFIEAESGTGKSRLVGEAEVDAKLAGAVVARVDCETATGGPYDAIRRLLLGLFAAVPEDATEAAKPYAVHLGRVFPEVLRHVRGVDLAEPAQDPAEERMRVQRALSDWVLALATRRPIVLCVDDLQRCDEASAAVLASLSRESAGRRLLILCALRTGEDIRAPLAVEALRGANTHVVLGGLRLEEVEDLVLSLFGDVPRAQRLAAHLHEATDGSPLYCTELARYLVDQDVIRYVDGEWQLPSRYDESTRPVGLAQTMEARVRRVSDGARALGEALSIHGGELPLELIADLGEVDGDALFPLLDELTHQGILVGDGHVFRFRHDSLREALLRCLSPERKRALHLRVAATLLEDGDLDTNREAEVGWHLFHGGDRSAAAAHLEHAGRHLYESQALSDCIAPLEAAYTIYAEDGRERPRQLLIQAMLVAAGWISNREVGLRHAWDASLAWREYSGIALADRLRFLGRHLAIIVALAWVGIKWLFERGPTPAERVIRYAQTLAFSGGLYNASNHVDELKKLVKLADPLAVFDGRFIYASYLSMNSFPDILLGHLGAGAEKLSHAIDIVMADKLTPILPDERDFAESALRGLRGLIDVNQFHPRLTEELARIDELASRYYRLVVQVSWAVHHRYRGNEERARQIEESISSASLQLGSWSTDLQALLFAHPAYALCEDVVGLKRCLDQLERRCAEGMRFEDRVLLTRAEIARLRGDYDESYQCIDRVFDMLTPDNMLFRQWGGSALAATALSAGDYERAAEAARDVIAIAADEKVRVVIPWLRAERVLALAEDALGHHQLAIERIQRVTHEVEALGITSLAGHAHEARARMALRGGDASTYLFHCNEANRFYRETNNPSLIAIGERLLDAGKKRKPRRSPSAQSMEAVSSSDGQSRRTPHQSSTVLETVSQRPESQGSEHAGEEKSSTGTMADRPSSLSAASEETGSQTTGTQTGDFLATVSARPPAMDTAPDEAEGGNEAATVVELARHRKKRRGDG